MNSRKIFIPVLLFLMFMCTGFLYASLTDTVSVENDLNMDTVDIGLKDYMLENGKKADFIFDDTLLPGKTVSWIPEISNKGVDCYLRAKISIISCSGRGENLDLSHISGISDEWIYKENDGYYYYRDVLEEDESVDLFDGFTIPSEWGNDIINNIYDIDIRVDAVQKRNFELDTDSADPWHGTAPEKTVRSRDFKRQEAD